MPIFKCENCGCLENTALGFYWFADKVDRYDWSGIEERKGMKLCSECAPQKFKSGEKTGYGKWHNKFPKRKPTEEESKHLI